MPPADPHRAQPNRMILASGHAGFQPTEAGLVDCRIMGSNTFCHAKTPPSHPPAASRARVADFRPIGRSGARVFGTLAGHSRLAASAPAGQRAGRPHRGRLLVSAGQLECSGRETATTGACFAGPFVDPRPGRDLDPNQGAKPRALSFTVILPAFLQKKDPDRGSGPFQVFGAV